MSIRWSLLGLALLLIAPVIYLAWGVSAELGRLAAVTLPAIASLGALVTARTLDPRRHVRGLTGTWVPTNLLAAALALAVIGLGLVSHQALTSGDVAAQHFWAFATTFIAAFIAIEVLWRRAGARWRSWPAEELRIHLLALCLVPAGSLSFAVVISQTTGTSWSSALLAGLSAAWVMAAVTATAVVCLRLKKAGNRAARFAQPDTQSLAPLPWQPRVVTLHQVPAGAEVKAPVRVRV